MEKTSISEARSRRPRAAFATAILAVACAGLRGAPAPVGPVAWPRVDSDLAPDPAVLWGTLPNGLRYAVRHNAEPAGRVSIRLLVAAGSMEERGGEEGIAHFIEHMAFRGTREHPNGAMTTELQRLGVALGPDSTAYTFPDHTIYQLDLPDAGIATLRQGLGMFREYASDITFDQALIDRERDVILNERDIRDTPPARVYDANVRLLWPGALQNTRKPIGLAENIRRFVRQDFVSFYDAWYRPERMAVIVVGDIEPGAAAKAVGDVMRELKARAPARGDLIKMEPDAAGNADIRVFMDPGLSGASAALEHPFPDPASPDTHARRVARARRGLAFEMLAHRALKFSKTTGGRLVVPVANLLSIMPGWSVAEFGGSGSIENWQAFMTDLEQEHRRAYDYGFTDEETAIAKTAYETQLDYSVRTSPTWPSDWIAGQIADSMVAGRVFSSPATLRDDLCADLAATTPKECLDEFRKTWSSRSLSVFVSTNPLFHVTRSEVAQALNESRAKPVSKPAETKAAVFAYTDFGPAGAIVRQSDSPDLGVTQCEFGNGVRLNFKHTEFEAGTVLVAVRIGNGRLSQPRDEPGLDMLANYVIPFGGVGKHSVDDLQDVVAAHSITLGFTVGFDCVAFTSRCAPKDLDFCLQLIGAYVTDAAYRGEAMPQARASAGDVYSSLRASAMGPITLESFRVLSGGDQRFGLATPPEFGARSIDEVRRWLEPQFKRGPIELSIVGDTTWDAASADVAATLGALPARLERRDLPSLEILNFHQSPMKDVYLSLSGPNVRQVALAVYCAIPNLDDIHLERRCRMLAAIFTERMRLRLREQLGAAYAFSADVVECEGFPNMGFFTAYTMVAPVHARRADELIRQEIRSLKRGNISEDEFRRSREPFLKSREKDLQNNDYWSTTVLADAQQRPQRLAAARDREKDCEAITRADLEAIAKRYFAPERWFRFVSYPQGPTTQLPSFNPNVPLGPPR